ncbi:MAG: hypothetical protein ACTHJX_00270, partial [Terriglobales bacterium]
GAAFFTASNLGPVALINYWLGEVPRTDRQQMQARERAADRSGADFKPYPTPDELAAMNAQQPPAYSVVISDTAGKPLRILSVPARAGLGRINWDLRTLATPERRAGRGFGGGGGAANAGGGRGGRGGPAGPTAPPEGGGTPGSLVLPGRYQVALYQHWQDKWTELGRPQTLIVTADPHSTPPLAALTAHAEFMQKLEALQNQLTAVQAYANQISADLTTLRATAAAYPAQHQALIDHTDAAEKQFAPIASALAGGFGFDGGRSGPPSLSSRLGNAAGAESRSLSAPTQTSLDDVKIATDELAKWLPQLQKFGTTDLPALEREFTTAGAPVPATLPAWPPDAIPPPPPLKVTPHR